jgi:serine/threonine protein kinase/tetratricopeptide (TPR) repeat protein
MNDLPAKDVEIFSAAIELPASDRAAYLDQACQGDPELRNRVEALLREHDELGDFLEESPSKGVTQGAGIVGLKPGDRIGRYKLLKQLGEGGCGVVYMAEQEEPVRRRVALKIIKPGMDTKSVIARFEAERQALALMDHPNIAHVFDAGSTENGRPYFVMELVEGVRITSYCDQYSLSTRARLELFVQVCDAIQHAHQKGIIHRDIKPSNILVAAGADGKQVPKVIDFGIAKATTGQQLTDKTIFTAFEMLIGTPAYMSPEQAALTSSDVDTRTDIYSLGVLLYELLTGTTPFDARELLKAGLDEVRRVIRDEVPVRPSRRLTIMVAANLANVSVRCGAEAPRLIRQLRGELDWIVMKALEKDRERRYQTTNTLAGDIQRYLKNETVSARPPSRLYQFRKLASRHKLEFAALGIVMATLVAGLGITTWSLAKEKRAHIEARTEATRSGQVARFLDGMLTSGDPVLANGRGSAEAMWRDMLDRAAKRVGTELTNQPAVQADMRMTIGRVYEDLGLFEKAETIIQEALTMYCQLPKSESSNSEEKVAHARLALSGMYSRQGKIAESREEADKALAIVVKLKGEETMEFVKLETRLARCDLAEDNPAEAESLARRALATGRRLVGDRSVTLLETKLLLAEAVRMRGSLAEAQRWARDCVSVAQQENGSNSLSAASSMYYLAFYLDRQGNLGEAETVIRQSLAIQRKNLPANHPMLEETLLLLGAELQRQGKTDQAVDAEREVLGIRRNLYRAGDDRVMQTATTLVKMLVPDFDEAKVAHLASEIPEAWAILSEKLAKQGRWQDARTAAARMLELQPSNPSAYHLMAPLLVQTGDRRGYEDLCTSITTKFAGANDPYTADRMAKDCLILPSPGADLKVPARLAEIAVTAGRGDSSSLPYFQCCKALAELRQGRHEAAANWAQLAAKGTNPHSQAEALAITAMSHFKLGQLDKARTALISCNKVIEEKLPKAQQGSLGNDWRDWIIAHALQSEAKQMIEGGSSPAAPPASLPK